MLSTLYTKNLPDTTKPFQYEPHYYDSLSQSFYCVVGNRNLFILFTFIVYNAIMVNSSWWLFLCVTILIIYSFISISPLSVSFFFKQILLADALKSVQFQHYNANTITINNWSLPINHVVADVIRSWKL